MLHEAVGSATSVGRPDYHIPPISVIVSHSRRHIRSLKSKMIEVSQVWLGIFIRIGWWFVGIIHDT